jgi:hypothetical protein
MDEENEKNLINRVPKGSITTNELTEANKPIPQMIYQQI